MTSRALSLVLLAVAIALNAAGQLCLKRATIARAAHAVAARDVFLSPWLVFGAFALGASMLLWVQVLRRVPLTVAHPLTGAVFIVVPVASHLLWGEPLGALRLFGIGVIVVGIALVASGA